MDTNDIKPNDSENSAVQLLQEINSETTDPKLLDKTESPALRRTSHRRRL